MKPDMEFVQIAMKHFRFPAYATALGSSYFQRLLQVRCSEERNYFQKCSEPLRVRWVTSAVVAHACMHAVFALRHETNCATAHSLTYIPVIADRYRWQLLRDGIEWVG